MPRLSSTAVPKYRHHKSSDQAYVVLNGRELYLGRHGTKTSKAEYDRIVGEWIARGRCLGADITVTEIISGFWKHALEYYRAPDGELTGETETIKQALGP